MTLAVLFSTFFLFVVHADPGLPLFNAALPGTIMPAVGLGTGGYGTEGNIGGEYWDDETARKAVLSWLSSGGIRIDNANDYNVTTGVAMGIQQSQRERSSIFVVSKVAWRYAMGYEEAIQQTEDILKSLSLSYVDLLLIHWPGPAGTEYNVSWPCYQNQTFKKCRQDTWRALEEIFKAGKARAIGVSNFEKTHLEDIFELGGLIPAVNQVEYHPYNHEYVDDLVKFCEDHKILFNSYSSVGCPDHMSLKNNRGGWPIQVIEQPVVQKIAEKYRKTPAQVVLRWSWQQKIVVNARSWDPTHHAENLNIFDFELTNDEMKAISSLPKQSPPRVCYDPN